jgi:hypothetical protein
MGDTEKKKTQLWRQTNKKVLLKQSPTDSSGTKSLLCYSFSSVWHFLDQTMSLVPRGEE